MKRSGRSVLKANKVRIILIILVAAFVLHCNPRLDAEPGPARCGRTRPADLARMGLGRALTRYFNGVEALVYPGNFHLFGTGLAMDCTPQTLKIKYSNEPTTRDYMLTYDRDGKLARYTIGSTTVTYHRAPGGQLQSFDVPCTHDSKVRLAYRFTYHGNESLQNSMMITPANCYEANQPEKKSGLWALRYASGQMPSHLSVGDGPLTAMHYLPPASDRMALVHAGGKKVEEFYFGPDGRLLRHTIKQNGMDAFSRSFTYGQAGRLEGQESLSYGFKEDFAYDASGRPVRIDRIEGNTQVRIEFTY